MDYKPFKMRSSPMKRNFGVGEKEEVSPGKNLGKILSGLGDSVQAGLDAGAGTSHGVDKEAKAKAEADRLQKDKDKDKAMERQKELFSHQSKVKKDSKKVEGDLNGDGVVDEHDKKLEEEGAGDGADASADAGAGDDAGSGVEYNKKKRTPAKIPGLGMLKGLLGK